jgi:hypothetical protein
MILRIIVSASMEANKNLKFDFLHNKASQNLKPSSLIQKELARFEDL